MLTFFGISIGDIERQVSEGNHLRVQRFGYTHHGIYVGNNEVIHYLDSGVAKDSVSSFADGADIEIIDYSSSYSGSTIVERAESRLYEDDYNVVWENCEQFALWCRR